MSDDLAILAAIDTLVLERTEGRRFRCLGAPPSWCSQIWPPCAPAATGLVPEDQFPFLQVFLGEAEQAWTDRSRVDSETWTRIDEKGEQLHLQATALCVGAKDILLIGRCDALHGARQQLLQRARELRLVYDLAARTTEQKDVLVHCIIHDLQVPLGTILGALSELHEEVRAPTASRLAERALQAAQKQRELILDILQLFAAEPSAPGATELVPVVTAAAMLFEPVARARGQSLAWDPTPFARAGLRVVGDPRRLERVVANLMENAVRNALAAVSVDVHTEGRQVQVDVEDDGPAMPPDVASGLFAKLGHGDEPSNLGLYFCRITVERWGGSIGYEPRPGGGTRFWLRLPIAAST